MSQSEVQAGNWDEDFEEKEERQESNKIAYMDMSKPGAYRIRLVGSHVKFRKHFVPYQATVQDSDKDVDPAWQAGFYPNQRFAINVIDRADNTLKILEKGPSVFKHFAHYKSLFDVDPAGKNGSDFSITVKIPKLPNGKPNKLKTEYTVTHLDKAPFTAEDMKILCETDSDGNIIKKDGKPVSKLWKLKSIYRSTTPEKMQQMWDDLPDDKKVPPKRKDDKDESPRTVAAEKKEQEEAPANEMDDSPADNGDDLFESGDSGEDSTELF